MKRDHPNLCQENLPRGVGTTNSSSVGDGSSGGTGNFLMTTIHGKSKVWDETEQDAGVDELLAIFGYKVESSNMAKVAQKLEQLEELMVSVQEDGLSHLASDSIHYNPSDLSSRLESMISELNSLLNFDSSSLMQGPFT